MRMPDITGLEITAASEKATGEFNRTLDAFLTFDAQTPHHLHDALDADPEMVMANAFKAISLAIKGTPHRLPEAREAAQTAQAAATNANVRERLHADAASALVDGKIDRATGLWESILIDWPTDIVALRIAHHMYMMTGQVAQLRDSILRVFPEWRQDIPGYSVVLAMLAFGHEENGSYSEAESLARQSIELEPRNLWGIHALAHVFEMQDRCGEGLTWFDTVKDGWADRLNFRYHLQWHRLLLMIGKKDYEAALAAYDTDLYDPASEEYLDLSNDAATLLRLEIEGVDVGGRWGTLAEKAEPWVGLRHLAFIDVHTMLILANAGRFEMAETMLADQRTTIAQRPETTISKALAQAIIEIGEAIFAYAKSDYSTAIGKLLPIREHWNPMGGSKAQRDVLNMILIDAAQRGGRHSIARGLLAERTALRPTNVWGWERYSKTLSNLGKSNEADHAQGEVIKLLGNQTN